MLDLAEINKEIENIMAHGNTFEDCHNLANLLICRAGIQTANGNELSQTSASFALQSGTEFAEVVNSIPANKVILIMDELMTVLQAVNPSLYEGVMRKMREAVY